MLGVLQGDVCCLMNQVQTVLSQWRAGKVRLLGVTTPKRVEVVAEVPPEVRQKLVATGNTVRIESPAEFRATVKEDRARWGELVRTIGVTIE